MTTALDLVDRDQLDARHSAYLVVEQLRVLQLQAWAPRVMDFLRHYDGLEPMMDPRDQEPVVFVRQAIFGEVAHLRHDRHDARAVQCRLAHALADAPFASYGACFKLQGTARTNTVASAAACAHPAPPRIVWRPLEQTWLEFLESGPSEADGYWLDIFSPSPWRARAQDIIRFLLL